MNEYEIQGIFRCQCSAEIRVNLLLFDTLRHEMFHPVQGPFSKLIWVPLIEGNDVYGVIHFEH